ncbi:MAG: flagellar basal body rod protein FlgC [Bdellovibrionales bacterium]|nr:flagellar basal body rod protein FlgC [Bdellovibrionales bacterium]
MFKAIETLAAGLSVARMRVNVLASNIANAETTRTEEGGPYKKRLVSVLARPFKDVLDEVTLAQPEVAGVIEDQSKPKMVYRPGHPDANEQGYVEYPNINIVAEMTELMNASKAYEAATAAIQSTKQLEERGASIAGRF